MLFDLRIAYLKQEVRIHCYDCIVHLLIHV